MYAIRSYYGTVLFSLLSGSLLALPAGATPFAFNARNDAMGGTGVASSDYLAAAFRNNFV